MIQLLQTMVFNHYTMKRAADKTRRKVDRGGSKSCFSRFYSVTLHYEKEIIRLMQRLIQ